MAMVEEYQHATAAGSAGAGKKLNCSPQVGSTCLCIRNVRACPVIPADRAGKRGLKQVVMFTVY
jgi:hypothetical protein